MDSLLLVKNTTLENDSGIRPEFTDSVLRYPP